MYFDAFLKKKNKKDVEKDGNEKKRRRVYQLDVNGLLSIVNAMATDQASHKYNMDRYGSVMHDLYTRGSDYKRKCRNLKQKYRELRHRYEDR